MRFVDREEDLEALRRTLDHGPSLIRVYGRRRLGKTEMLTRLCRERRGTYLLVEEGDLGHQLRSLAHQLPPSGGPLPSPFPTWPEVLERIAKLRTPFVVLDEFQRLVRKGSPLESQLQHHWDSVLSKRGPSLVLCGSSVGMMRRLTRRPQAPLFGRLHADLHLRPLGYAAVRELYQRAPEEERIRRYAVFGGTPFYHTFSVGRGLDEALTDALLSRGAPLLDEPLNLLRLEIGTPDRYHSLMEEIGRGTHDLPALEASFRTPSGRLTPYIALLRDDLDLIRMENPVGGPKKRARYVFADPFFAFYYRFVPEVRPLIEAGSAADALVRIQEGLEAHVGRVFERVAAEALMRLNGSAWRGVKIEFQEIGRWWSRRGEEVDLVARGGAEVLAGEVKWGGGPMKPGVLWSLERKADGLDRPAAMPLRFVFASRHGFTAAMRREAGARGAILFDLADLTEVFSRARPSGDRPSRRERPR